MIFGLHLQILEKERIRHQKSKILQPINELSTSTQRIRAKELAKPMLNVFTSKTQSLYHSNDHPMLEQVTFGLSDTIWNIQFGQKDKDEEQKKSKRVVKAIDEGRIARKGYRSLAAITHDLPREYLVAQARKDINISIAKDIKVSFIDINQYLNSDILIDDMEEVHIRDEQVIRGVTESIGKAGYRNIKDIIKYIIPILIKEQVLDPLQPIIHIRISGDGRNVGRKVKHIMVTFAILNDQSTINQPNRHYTIALFPGIEKYDALQIALDPLRRDLYDLRLNGIIDEFGRHWKTELYFSSDWKFLTICLGFNAANSTYFCPWCTCQKSEIGLIDKVWMIEKSMDIINQDVRSYPGHNKKPLFDMIVLEHWVPDELHILLRITDRLWNLVIQECKNDNEFDQECRQSICNEMNRIGVKFQFWQDPQSQNWTHTSLMGEDKLKVLKDFNLSVCLYTHRARKVRELWDGFYALYQAVKNPLTDPVKFKDDARNWLHLFLTPSSGKRNTRSFIKGLYNPVDITPYMHVLIYHVAEFMTIHRRWGFSAFSCSAVEKKNHEQVSYFFSNTMKDGKAIEVHSSAILDLLDYENRALYFLRHEKELEGPKFKKFRYQ